MSWNWLAYPLSAAYLIALALLFTYGVNCYVLILYHRCGKPRAKPLPRLRPEDSRPLVTVQLPIYNEKYVAQRVIEAAGRLLYPADRLQIQVLDDSTDDTTVIAAMAVGVLRARGLNVEHVRRGQRTGYKAGALREGLRTATGEFIAMFDADFVPPGDFLERTIPGFADPQVGVVQTRWGHLNREYSPLTGAQAIGIDGHFGVEQGARCWGGLFLNFNGTAGVWRAKAIADAGGWTHDTLTEDLDLSYRAQLRGWSVLFLPDVVCPAELPVQIAGFKAQQRRWATGTIQATLKLVPRYPGRTRVTLGEASGLPPHHALSRTSLDAGGGLALDSTHAGWSRIRTPQQRPGHWLPLRRLHVWSHKSLRIRGAPAGTRMDAPPAISSLHDALGYRHRLQ